MRYFKFAAILIVLIPSVLNAAEKYVYLFPDFVGINMPSDNWEVKYPGTDDKVVELEAKNLDKNEYFHTKFIVRRMDKNSFGDKQWKNFMDSYFSKLYQNSFSVPQDDDQRHYVSYTFFDHYLPVEGLSISKMNRDHIYVFECQRQKMDANVEYSLSTWCSGFFDRNTWPEGLEHIKDQGNFVQRWSRIDFSQEGMKAAVKKIVEKSQRGVIDEGLLVDYIGIIISGELFEPGFKSREDQLKELSMLEMHLGEDENPVLRSLVDMHRLYLSGNIDRAKERIAALVGGAQEIPYWILSRWIKDRDFESGYSFAQRAMVSHPTLVSAYNLAWFQDQRGEPIDDDLVKKLGGLKNPVVASLLASNAHKTGKKAEAEKYIKVAEKLSPDDVSLLLVKARYYSKLEGGENYDKALSVYKKLAEIKTLDLDRKVELYFEWADIVFDTNQKIELYNKIIALKPELPKVYYVLGKLYLVDKSNMEEAVKYFKQYIKYAGANDARTKELKALITKIEAPKPIQQFSSPSIVEERPDYRN